MKYEYPTVSRPVTGRTADRIVEAVENGGHVASPEAVQVMQDLFTRHRSTGMKRSSQQPKKKAWGKRKVASKA